MLTAVAMTEPGTGSDLAGIRTTAVRDGDHWIVNGAKTFITGGIQADLVIVVARTSTDPDNRRKGLTLLVVEDGMEGFTRGRKLDKIGQYSADTAELFFEDVKVPKENLVGQLNHGWTVGKRLLQASSRYAHARQMKRARACTRKLRTQLGRVVREIERQVTEPSEKLARLLATAHRIHVQQRHDKNKVYSVHEPEVECIAKGKAGKPYEFGNKVSVAVTSRGGWLVGAQSFTGNPYDGHTLAEQMKQVRSMIGDRVGEAHVDMGYRGHDYEGQATVHVDKRSRPKS